MWISGTKVSKCIQFDRIVHQRREVGVNEDKFEPGLTFMTWVAERLV